MKFLIVLAFAMLVTLGIVPPGADRAEAQSRSKTECTVLRVWSSTASATTARPCAAGRKPARHGNSAAQCNIARMYGLGEGVPHNKMEAYKWMTIASRAGRPEATKVLSSLKKQMSPEEIADAEPRIRHVYTEGRR